MPNLKRYPSSDTKWRWTLMEEIDSSGIRFPDIDRFNVDFPEIVQWLNHFVGLEGCDWGYAVSLPIKGRFPTNHLTYMVFFKEPKAQAFFKLAWL